MKSLLRVTTLIGILLLLAGCGFHLRGAMAKPWFSKVYLAGSVESGVADEIRRTLTQDIGVTLAPKPDQADLVLDVTSLSRDKQILALNTLGQVSQYNLMMQLAFRASDPTGRELLQPTTINSSRVFYYNDAQILAKQQEELLLWRDMQDELIRQMIRRLSAVKPPPASPSQKP